MVGHMIVGCWLVGYQLVVIVDFCIARLLLVAIVGYCDCWLRLLVVVIVGCCDWVVAIVGCCNSWLL